ncbi:hypothetical protein [Pseudoduganella violaceinigra]|uniref:hypothetical protein n=1 Tax=Pseudoduganella violaceinigra TaxID=246602 RepID=UPI000687936B|nr:hypothetical protein [Pseudoduganella violaceinigra]
MANIETATVMPASITAEIATNAPANAALILSSFSTLFGPQQLVPLVDSLNALAAKVQGGDLSVVEQMLVSQAVALQGVFTNLTHRAAAQTNPRLLQTQLGLALRAQSQARSTLEALIQLKQPPSPTYISQANIAAQQQVNNLLAETSKPLEVCGFNQNKLMEACDEQRLDAGAAATPKRADPGLATLATINRA